MTNRVQIGVNVTENVFSEYWSNKSSVDYVEVDRRIMLSRVCVTYKTGYGLDDWIS
jgi:hypothetical protein